MRFRNYATDMDEVKRKLKSLSDDRKALFGSRYTDEPQDEQLEQRQQLLSGTDRLERSSARLTESQRIALETEDIGRGTLADLGQQGEIIMRARAGLQQGEGYVDHSIKTLRGMARRYYSLCFFVPVEYFLSFFLSFLMCDLYILTLFCVCFRMATNRIISIAIITVLILLIFAVIYSKFH